MSRLRLRPGSCRDIVHVEPVPACPGEEVQAAATADYPGARWERLSIREHDPVFAGRPGAVSAKFGEGEPVTVRAVAPEQRDTRARRRQGAGALDFVVPAGHGAVADAHDREIAVVAGPGARVIDVEGVAVADRVPR